MELVYLWIYHYNNIYQTGFNFSSEYNIQYDEASKGLQIIKNDSEPLKIFNESFLNINAIIGKNGSGKTNLLSFLKTLYSNEVYSIGSKYILITKNEHGQLSIIDKVSSQDKSIKVYPENVNHEISKDSRQLADKVSLIFFSNSYSIYEDTDRHRTYYDCSLNGLIYAQSIASNTQIIESYKRIVDHYKTNEDEESQKSKEEEERDIDFLIKRTLPKSFIFSKEILNQIQFISNYINSGFDFIPRHVDIGFNTLFINEIDKKALNSINKLEAIFSLINRSRQNNDDDNKVIFREKLILAIFLFIWKHQLFEETRNLTNEDINEKIKVADDAKIPEVILAYIKQADPHPYDQNIFTKIVDFISILDDHLELIHFHDYNYSNVFPIELTANLLELLKRLFQFWYDNNFVFHFNWYGMSAGESAILTLFARIFDVSRMHLIKDTIWLLIDEGELYLHPEWQRNFINDLHTYLPEFFGEKKIHLILTSHSPFVASDIPKDNTILLSTSERKICTVVDPETLSNTFGANIHELLKDSFFLEKGSIGEFSRLLIDDLFNYLNRNESTYNLNKEKAQKLIEIIGEPIVKLELIRLFDRKYNENNELTYLQSESERIQRRISEITNND